MQRLKGTSGWTVFTVVAVIALGSTIASSGFGRRAERDLANARSKLAAQGGLEERVPPPAVPEYRQGVRDLEAGRLVAALERADRIDRSRTLVASLVAGKLFDGVAEHVDAQPSLLDDPRLAAAIRRSAFDSARHPLEGERLRALSVIASGPSEMPIHTGGFAESTAVQAMTDADAAVRAMENGVLVGDRKACEDAAERRVGLATHLTVGASICRSAEHVVASGQRFRRLQARAALHARGPRSAQAATATMTARVAAPNARHPYLSTE